MEADLPDIERSQQFLDAPVDGVNLGWCQETAGYAGLVRQDSGAQTQAAQPPEHIPGMRHRPHKVWIAVVRHITDQGAVPVEQCRQQPEPPWTFHIVPVPRNRRG